MHSVHVLWLQGHLPLPFAEILSSFLENLVLIILFLHVSWKAPGAFLPPSFEFLIQLGGSLTV